MTETGEMSFTANILVVDDVAENLQVLTGMLKEQGYVARPVPSGKMALMAARSEAPDLILLDITMPEMNGYEVCEELKRDPLLREIPVLFISALSETMDKVRAFQAGGVDYVTKPFQFEEVSARVRTHLELRRSQLELQTLLTKTFVASLKTMTDILSIVDPVLFDRSNRIKRYVRSMSETLGIKASRSWHYEMAAMLSQIGCVTIPKEILQKKQESLALSDDEERIFRNHPGVAAELIGGIPRLETVVAVIKAQLEPLKGAPLTDVQGAETVLLGSRLLRLALEYDLFRQSGSNAVAAFQTVQEIWRDYSPPLLKALRVIVEQEEKETVRAVKITELRTGMILMENVMTESGLLVLNKSNELSANLLSLLKHYAGQHPLREPIQVLDKVKQ
ncbi:MAG TPA: response regulator [Patescibacteria group bacterium]|nr:response regulator [Patescibacteria group bacterium]